MQMSSAKMAAILSKGNELTHWDRYEMNNISQTTLSNVLYSMKMFEFRLKFHWSLFPVVQLTIFQHWIRLWLGAVQATSHYLNQWWFVYRRIYASLSLNELMPGAAVVCVCVYVSCCDDINAVNAVLVLEIHLKLHLLPAWHPCCFACMQYTHFHWLLFSITVRKVSFLNLMNLWTNPGIRYQQHYLCYTMRILQKILNYTIDTKWIQIINILLEKFHYNFNNK